MHVSWKTASENQKDRYRDSGLTSRTKLTPEDVDKIRLLDGRAKPSDMAKQFGVSLRNIRLILAGETWKSDPVGRRIFTPEEVLSILGRPEVTAVALASEFRATKSQIDRIRHRKSYRWVDVGAATTPS